MKTVQMTLDEHLVDAVDKVVKELHTTRSAFARLALQEAVVRARARMLEEKHRQGYLRQPAETNEFAVWEQEQKWGDE